MLIELQRSTEENAHIVKNLWPLYQHELSAFVGTQPNRHGLFGVDDTVATLAQLGDTMNAWWKAPASLFPYLIVAEGRPAGFNLIATGPYLPEGVPADFVVHEFFVLNPFRGTGVAEKAALLGFAAHLGRWEVVTDPSNTRGVSFWRRVIARESGGRFTEREQDHSWGRKVVFRFENCGAAQGEPSLR